MDSEKGAGASVWLIPQKEISSSISPIISTLSQKYSSPLFEPHITLFNNCELKNNSIELFKKTFREFNEFAMDVTGVDYDNEDFKCVFLSLKLSENFKDFAKKSEFIFKSSEIELTPHISLIYSHIAEDERKKMANSLSDNFKSIEKIQIKKAKLYLTSGTVYSWKELASVSLNKI